eukprot:Nitzschia sp. Nitz4//scaffold20_size174350//157730//159097//NITZ4_002133-RA/size174350-processed-gene-0.119-mRNA-1//-1//CDS//3329541902//3880//frame0
MMLSSFTKALSHRRLQVHTSLRSISYAQLTVDPTRDSSRLRNCPPKEQLEFGSVLADHMLTIEYTKEGGWSAPRIGPVQNLSISPASSCLQYGLQCFEGLKAYHSLTDDSIKLFRVDQNVHRLKSSMDRLHMPGIDFDENELIRCIAQLVSLDRDWIPEGEGYSLYLRPTAVATHQELKVAPPDSVMIYVITSPVGPYYKSGFKPVRLTTDTPYIRAWHGGTGNAKVGGNYGPTMKATAQATEAGYGQVLWLFGEEDFITEVGAMNVFFLMVNKDTGRRELVTPPLCRGDILPGITRASILELTSMWGEFNVSERNITMGEVREAADDGRLLEAFGSGTAAVVSPIECIQYQGRDIEIPAVGKVTQRVWNQLTGIQYGTVPAPAGWIFDVDELVHQDVCFLGRPQQEAQSLAL